MAKARTDTSTSPVPDRGRRAQLSAGEILAAAEQLLNREGIEGLSMRRLGMDLDVWPMSLYRYFRNKDELLDALVSRAVESIPPPDDSAEWRAQLTDLARGLADAVARLAPDLAPRFLPPSPAAARLEEHAAKPLAQAGLSPAESRSAWEALTALVIGASFANSPGTLDFGIERLLDGLAAAYP